MTSRALGLRAAGDDRAVALGDGTEVPGSGVILATGVECLADDIAR